LFSLFARAQSYRIEMTLPLSELGSRQTPSDITRLMTTAIQYPNLLSLAAGFTDNESLPLAHVKEIVDEIASEEGIGKTTLQYGDNAGRGELRSILLNRIESFDASVSGKLDPEALFISNGSQQALYLAIQTLCDPGDLVLVEQPTYFVFLEILSGLNVTPIGIPMTPEGKIDVAGLEGLLRSLEEDGRIDRLKALYLVSYFANPSGRSVSSTTKAAIGEMLGALSRSIAIIEDAAYRELYFDQAHESGSSLSLEAFQELPIFYTSTLTKPYASGLKVGFAYCSDTRWRESMLSVKGQQDFGTANFAQAIVERALQSGRFDRHLSNLREIYRRKMAVLNESLGDELRTLGWKWEVPEGGLYLWLKSPGGMRTDAESEFHAACLDAGVFYVPGDLCYPGNAVKDRIRLSFGVLAPKEIEQAAIRFKKAAASMTRSLTS